MNMPTSRLYDRHCHAPSVALTDAEQGLANYVDAVARGARPVSWPDLLAEVRYVTCAAMTAGYAMAVRDMRAATDQLGDKA
jgi:hypothetical protein